MAHAAAESSTEVTFQTNRLKNILAQQTLTFSFQKVWKSLPLFFANLSVVRNFSTRRASFACAFIAVKFTRMAASRHVTRAFSFECFAHHVFGPFVVREESRAAAAGARREPVMVQRSAKSLQQASGELSCRPIFWKTCKLELYCLCESKMLLFV